MHGSSTGSALARVREALERGQDYVLTAPSADTLQVARRRGTIARRTELCTIRAVQEPQQLVVTVSGDIGGDAVEIVRSALLDRTRSSPAEINSFQPPAAPGERQAFTPPSDWFVTTAVPAPLPPPTTPVRNPVAAPSAVVADATVLRASDRTPAFVTDQRTAFVCAPGMEPRPLTTVLLFGRDPQPRPSDIAATRSVPLADAAMSKTHLAIGPAPDGLWIQDRNSSNGTELVVPSGTQRLQPDVRTNVTVPCVIRAGDTTIEIGWSA